MSETSEIVTPLLDALESIPGVVALRLHAGSVRVAGGWMRNNRPGTPDILAIVFGFPVFLECKTAKGLVSDAQLDWHAHARRQGCDVVVVRSVSDGLRVVRARHKQQPAAVRP